MSPIVSKIMDRCVRDELSGCLVWTRGKTPAGYGRVWDPVARRQLSVHRVMYEAFIAPLEQGEVIDHLCRNRACCEPRHLSACESRTNWIRAHQLKPLCRKGHPLDGWKTVPGDARYSMTGGTRYCITCSRARASRSNARRRVKV